MWSIAPVEVHAWPLTGRKQDRTSNFLILGVPGSYLPEHGTKEKGGGRTA
jgi:hypothetical protein